MAGISAVFDAVSFVPPKKSTFDGSHDIKTSCKIGDVFPLDVVPVYPSDNFRMQYTSQAKFSPLVAPAFARMNLKQWSFFVRNADLWDDFQEFVSGVNPKLGKTAYNQDYKSELVHPYFGKGSLPLGCYLAKLNLSNVDLDKITIITTSNNSDIAEYRIDSEYINSLILAMNSQENLVSVSYNGSGDVSVLYGLDFVGSKLTTLDMRYMRLRTELNTEHTPYYSCRLNEYEKGDSFDAKDVSAFATWPQYLRVQSNPSLMEPGDLLDYLGYPVDDYASVLTNEDLLDSLMKSDNSSLDVGSLGYWLSKYIGYKGDSLFKQYWSKQRGVNTQYPTALGKYDFNNTTGVWQINDFYKGFGSDDFTQLDCSPSSGSGECTMFGVLARYLIWCKVTNHTTTMVDEAPFFDFYRLNDGLSFEYRDSSSLNMDSLRWRAYWKIWNDYFRHPNLTYEVPIPFDKGGDDYKNLIGVLDKLYLSSKIKGEGFYDWYGRDWYDRKVFCLFPDLDTYDPKSDFFSGANVVGNIFNEFCVNNIVKMLFEPFKHLRERDYITGCLPNTSVVDVVAPVMPPAALDAYNEKPWTNDSMSADGLSHDNTRIDPQRATEDAYNANVGWLDIENLRITQKLKEYFVSLRHAMGSFKDYVKVFFGADISDLTLHRAEFLGGNSQSVNVSELVSSASYESQPQGSLAGRANSFGQSGVIDKYVNDYGFIITLDCLSPIEINVGGLSRQLIRNTRFDYFNPKFAELGDMAVTKKEVSAALLFDGSSPSWYDEVFGYTPRYMDLKFIPSHVHGDFLGSLSDWHLDLIQSPINDKSVELSHAWLEERSSDRIFSEVYDDSSNCFIWSECRCVYQRALPSVSYEVIG